MLGRRVFVCVLSLTTSVMVAGYDDRPMNEDEYFGARMQEHHQGAGLYQEPQGSNKLVLLAGAIAGASIEWWWSARSAKKGNKLLEQESAAFVAEWNKERDALMARRTYPIKLLAHEVEEADVQLMQLVAAAEDAGVDLGAGGGGLGGGATRPKARSIQQDNMEYEEFKQPDTDGDNVISKTEFYQYIRKYLSLYPDTAEMDIPLFEDFDLNSDGVVSFDEWQMYLDRHQQQDPYAENDLMRGMYDSSAGSQNFNTLAQNLRTQGRAGGGRY
ncbi:unnamed protein product [Ectocarpus sp. CCAP 1310/34]|nr:unnamed protein product [Ectocarpus sp. CCAP 1310/34]